METELSILQITSSGTTCWSILVRLASYSMMITRYVRNLVEEGDQRELTARDVCLQRGSNVVQGNVIIGTNDNGIQVSSGAIIRNNIVVNSAYYGIFVSSNQLQTSGGYHDVKVEHNTVYGSGSVDLYLPVHTH